MKKNRIPILFMVMLFSLSLTALALDAARAETGSSDLLVKWLPQPEKSINQANFDLSYFVAPSKVIWGTPIPTQIVIENFGTLPSTTAHMVNALPMGTVLEAASLNCTSGECYYNATLHQVIWNGSLDVGASATVLYTIIPNVPGGGPYFNHATISDGVAPEVAIHTVTYDAPAIIEQHTFEISGVPFYTDTVLTDWYWGDGVGDKPFHSGPKHWMTAPGGVSNYSDGLTSILYYDLDLSAYQAGDLIAMQWWEWYDLDPDESDVGTLSINGSPVYSITTSSPAWTHQQIDLSDYAGQIVQVTWELVSQLDGDTGMGWHIDEVSVHPWAGTADLALSMIGSPETLSAGDLLTYTLTVQNNGPLTPGLVLATDYLPEEVTYLRSDPPGACDVTGYQQVTCNMGSPGPGMPKDVTLLVQVRPGTPSRLIENTAVVDSELDDPDMSNNYAGVETMVTTGDETRPLIYEVMPAYGFNTAPITITIAGANFEAAAKVYLGTYQLIDPIFVNAQTLQAVIPAGLPPNTYRLTVQNPDNSYGSLANAFTVLDDAPLTIDEVKPKIGLTDVPVVLNIYGSNFTPDMIGWLSDISSTQISLQNIEFINIHQVRAMAPISMPMGIYALTLEDPATGLAYTLENAYTAFDPTVYDDLTAFDHGLWIGPPAPLVSTTATTGLMVYRLGGTDVLSDVKVSFALDGVFMGYGTVEMPALRGRRVATITWTAPITPGLYTLEATIDPDNLIPEADETNNLITRTIRILPATADDPPIIQSFAINNNILTTNSRQVTLDVNAIGNPAWLYYAEYAFNQNTNAWMPVGQSGWLPYAEASSGYTWLLEPVAGAHYIQVWAATAQGSVTPMPLRRLINWMPNQAPIAQGEGHIYRSPLMAGNTYVVRLISLEGDADLYLWAPNGILIERRETGDPIETIVFTAPVTGIYQIEVEGFTNARYRLEVYNVSDLLLLELPAPPNTILQPDRRGRDEPLSVDPPADEIGLPRAPETLFTILLPAILR